jgi:hypothetical protein
MAVEVSNNIQRTMMALYRFDTRLDKTFEHRVHRGKAVVFPEKSAGPADIKGSHIRPTLNSASRADARIGDKIADTVVR